MEYMIEQLSGSLYEHWYLKMVDSNITSVLTIKIREEYEAFVPHNEQIWYLEVILSLEDQRFLHKAHTVPHLSFVNECVYVSPTNVVIL